MGAAIDFSALTFTAEQVRDLNELLFDAIVEAGAFAKFHTVVTGIEYDQEVGHIGEFGLVGKAGQGCNPTADDFSLAITKKTWTPKTWEIIKDECFTDLAATLATYAKKFGTDEPDLTTTAYMALVEERLKVAIQKMLWRLAWFGDTAAANYNDSPAGKLTNTVDPDYFNVLDGFFKQLDTIVAATAARKTAIAANTSASAALQQSDFTPALAYAALAAVVYNAHPKLRGKKKIVYATRSVVDRLEQYLIGQSIVPQYENLINGFDFEAPALKILGVLVQPIDIWDEIILANYNNGTVLYRPHRIVMTTLENVQVGVPSTSVIEYVDVFYDKKSRVNRLEARDKMCPLFAIDSLVQVAY